MIILRRRALLGGLSALCLARPLAAQDVRRDRPVKAPEYRLFDSVHDSHLLSREDVTVDGRGYRLFRAVPRTAPPAGGWPSIWMLDGNSVFDRLGPEDLARHPGLAIVGVGYPVDQGFDTTSRALDYTPVSLVPEPEGGRRRATGGADAFRARLTGPLRRAAEGAGETFDPTRRVLWGHSYGGLFTLHCLLTAPDAFAAWVPVSPSSGFGGNALRHLATDAPRLSQGRIAPVRIMLGDSEHRRGTDAPVMPRPSPETVALAGLLGERTDLDVSLRVFEDHGHGQTFTASFASALGLAAAL